MTTKTFTTEPSIYNRVFQWIANGTFARFLIDIIAIFASFILVLNASNVKTNSEFEAWVFAAVLTMLCILVLFPAFIRIMYQGYKAPRYSTTNEEDL